MKRKKQYVKKLRKNYREDLQEIADYFKDKQKEVKKRSSYFQKATPPIGFCFVLLTWLLLGQDFFKNLSDVPLIKVYGLPAFFAITFFPLITLLFEMDTLLLKIYEECINILERALK